MDILGFFFPKRCIGCKRLGSYICADCFARISFDVRLLCLVCNRASFDGLTHPTCKGRYTIDGAFASIVYSGIVKKLIYNFKYKPYVSHLHNMLTDLFFEGIIQQEAFHKAYERRPLLVPIPLHNSKLRTRGYNQSTLLAKGLSQKLSLATYDLLERVKPTKTQAGLTYAKRLENIAGAFAIKTNSLTACKGKTIFLVDDILTTGSTLAEAANLLKRNGAKHVWGLTLARDQ